MGKNDASCAIRVQVSIVAKSRCLQPQKETHMSGTVVGNAGEVLSAGDEIVLSVLEHHSNLVPWQLLAKRKGLVLKFARLTGDSRIDAQHLRSLLTNRTRLIAVAHVIPQQDQQLGV